MAKLAKASAKVVASKGLEKACCAAFGPWLWAGNVARARGASVHSTMQWQLVVMVWKHLLLAVGSADSPAHGILHTAVELVPRKVLASMDHGVPS